MVSHWSLSDHKSPQVSRTLPSILSNHNKAVVWMVSSRPIISKSCTNPLVTVQLVTPSLSYSTVFYNSLARSRYSSVFSLSLNFILWSAGTAKSIIRQVLFFFCWLLFGGVCAFHFPYHLFVFYFLRVYHFSISWWFSTGIWVTASLIKSPGLFSVFWLISAML